MDELVSELAKMREALEFIKLASDDYEIYGTTKAGALDLIYEKACSALSIPVRNCDIGTVEEQLERHRLYCIGLCTAHECGYDLENHDTEKCKKCFAKWAQMKRSK